MTINRKSLYNQQYGVFARDTPVFIRDTPDWSVGSTTTSLRQHQPYRASEPHHADADEAIHAPNQWLQQEAGEPSGGCGAAFCVVQFRQATLSP